ncbi:MAG TPA: hypothetical protein VK083_04645 [Nocardia sp.]|uniref:hypothetical protein n=1 Tax=Nocardia TaxID=1817 RepID=UPI002456E7BF|nr:MULTISPECIES: hypothetical protein [Nocardia]HLS76066.1 hypothetical protein [Nocardia sp.]
MADIATSTAPQPHGAPDETMAAIADAVELGRQGDRETARTRLTGLWRTLGPSGDPLHRCSLAHYLADLQPDPAQSLAWNIRALDAAEALTDERAAAYHSGLAVAGFRPSLHLNLADDYRRLGSFDAARRELDAARAHLGALGQDAYGALIRTALHEVAQAVDAGDTAPRPSAPA